MNKLFKIFFLLLIMQMVVNCDNTNEEIAATIPARDFTEQQTADNLAIEDFLKTNKVDVDADFNATFTKLTTVNDPNSIFIANQNNTTNPTKLLFRMVTTNGITYKLYYLEINKGAGSRPTCYDDVLTSYRGNLITETTSFDENLNPETRFSLTRVIRSWFEIFPQFKGGTISYNSNGGKIYSNSGSGVIFVPSGLGYYNVAQTNIPAYSNLIFKFKLNDVSRTDLDFDGILNVDEDLNGDGYFDSNDNTDGDNSVNALDGDDDNDGYLTFYETKKPAGSLGSANYLFNDIPDCSGNTTNSTRVRKHLDVNCH